MTVSDFFQGAYSLIPKGLHLLLENAIKKTNSSLFQRRTVKEMLWGYKDPLLNQFTGFFSPVSKEILRLYTSKE